MGLLGKRTDRVQAGDGDGCKISRLELAVSSCHKTPLYLSIITPGYFKYSQCKVFCYTACWIHPALWAWIFRGALPRLLCDREAAAGWEGWWNIYSEAVLFSLSRIGVGSLTRYCLIIVFRQPSIQDGLWGAVFGSMIPGLPSIHVVRWLPAFPVLSCFLFSWLLHRRLSYLLCKLGRNYFQNKLYFYFIRP